MSRLRDLGHNVILAVTLLAGLGVALYYSYTLRQEDLKTWKRIRVKFTDVGGLKIEDPVMVNGHRVGRVSEILLKQDRQQVILTLEIEPELEIRNDYVAEVVPTSALGNVAVEINPPRGGSKGPVLDPEHEELIGKIREALGGASVPGPTRERELGKNIKGFAAETRRLLDPEESFLGGVLFSQNRQLELVDGLDSLGTTWEGIDQTLSELEYGETGVGGALSRESLLAATETFEAFANTMTSFRDGLRPVESRDGRRGLFFGDEAFAVGFRDAVVWQRNFWRDTVRGEGALGGWVTRDQTADTLHDLVHRLEVVTEKGTRGEGLLGVLGSKEGGDSAREFGRGLVNTTTNMRKSTLVRNKDARRDAADFVGNLDDFLVTLRRTVKALRAGLNDKTFQGAVFSIF